MILNRFDVRFFMLNVFSSFSGPKYGSNAKRDPGMLFLWFPLNTLCT